MTLRHFVLIGLFMIIVMPDAVPAVNEYSVGGPGKSWESTGDVLSGIDTGTEGGWLQAEKTDPGINILKKVTGKGGRVFTATGQQQLDLSNVVTDGQLNTGWQIEERRIGDALIIDLGVPFIVNRMTLSFGTSKVYTEADFMRSYEIYTNSGDPATFFEGDPVYTQTLRADNNESLTIDRSFPAQVIRYIKIRNTGIQKFLLAELGVFGFGYVPQSSYLSKIIDLGKPANFGDVRLTARVDPKSSLLLRTRSGKTSKPTFYFKTIFGVPPREEEVTRDVYERLPSGEQGRIDDDLENWSAWSPPYPLGGGPMRSPGNRQYVQFRIDLFSDALTDRAAINTLSLTYSQPVVAQEIIGEIFPEEVPVGEVSGFSYFVRPRISGENTGFDALEIRTPFEASVDGLKINNTQVTDFSWEANAERLTIRFPTQAIKTDNRLVEVNFRSLVTVYGTTFSGRAFDSRTNELPQDIVPGDATPQSNRNVLWVMTSLGDVIMSSVSVSPSSFSPNGDGVNDITEISYALLKVRNPTRVEVRLYSHGGKLVRSYTGRETGGIHTVRWDGRDDSNRTVPPGIYIYDITVETDSGSSRRSGTIGVVY